MAADEGTGMSCQGCCALCCGFLRSFWNCALTSFCLSINPAMGPKSVEEFQEALQELADGDSSVYWLLSQAVPKVREDRKCVLAAVEKNGLALDVASKECKSDKQIVLAAVKQDSDAFSYVDKSDKMWNDKNFVLQMVDMQGSALQFARPNLQADEEIVMKAISNKGSALQYADVSFKANKVVALAAVNNEGDAAFSHVAKTADMWKDKTFVLPMVKLQRDKALEYVDKHAQMWKDQDFVFDMVKLQGNALKFADASLKANKMVAVAAVQERSDALEFVAKNATFWGEKAAVLDLVQSTGRALEFAEHHIREDKDVVLAAVRTTPTSLKFAKGHVGQDTEVMKESGNDEYEQRFYDRKEQAILSLGSHSMDYAKNFAVLLKRNSFFRQFKTHNPNALGEIRVHLQECRETQGFMIQVQDKHGLDGGQKTETEMAQKEDVKIFRTLTTSEDVDDEQITVLQKAVEDWYKKGCRNHYMVELQLRK